MNILLITGIIKKSTVAQLTPLNTFIFYPQASLAAQLVKNPPAMHETLVGFLGREDPLEKG